MATALAAIDPLRAARLTPSAFARYVTGGRFQLPPHLAYLERVLVEVAAGRKKRVAVSVPPRHGKSFMCSRFFPAWFLGNFPDKRVILASYEADFAAQWGRDVRDLLTEHGPSVFGIRVRQDSSAANRWNVEGRQGGMQTAGAGGPVLGKGADIFLIDDPIKNYKEAHSEPVREGVWNWYRGVAYSRLEPGGAVVIVQQRTHEQDLIGRIVEEIHKPKVEPWELINFPAIAEDDDVLGRRAGQALWPERYDEAYLETTRRVSGTYLWSSMWQQRPTPDGGGLFKKDKATRYRFEDPFFVLLSTGERISKNTLSRFVTVDTATSEDERNDFTAIGAWGVTTDRRLILMDASIKRIEAPAIMREITAMGLVHKTQDGPLVPWIEEQSTSKHLLSFLKKEGLVFRSLKPDGDKFTRAIPASALHEHGRLILPESAPWLTEYERQLFSFPSGEHDDAVDMTSMAEHVMSTNFMDRLPSLPPFKPKTDEFAGFALRVPRGF